jgi:S1-C subfamily serine protease
MLKTAILPKTVKIEMTYLILDGVPDAPPLDDHNNVIDFGQGSGMIIKINNEYHILSNAHVVEGANRVYVLLTDGRKFQAELRGKDDIFDIVVLKIIVPDDVNADDESNDATLDLPFAEFGGSDTLEVGTFVTAIGSPGGLDNSCTIGIVSGLKRLCGGVQVRMQIRGRE